MTGKTITPRLRSGETGEVKGIRYKVGFWYPAREYEFTCVDEKEGSLHGKYFSEQAVSDGIKANKIKSI